MLRQTYLVVNPDKTKVVIVTKNEKVKEEFTVRLNGKDIKHTTEIKILGINVSESLMWDRHVEKNLLPQVKNRVRVFRIVSRYMGQKFRRMYANAIYRSKILYGIEAWGGVQKTLMSKLQAQQDIMSKLTLGKEGSRLSARQRQRTLNWLPISQEAEMASCKMTYKIINLKCPEELAAQMPCNTKGLRIKEQKKLDTKPSWLVKTKEARASYRGRAYTYNTLPSTLTTLPTYKKFRNQIKEHYLNKY